MNRVLVTGGLGFLGGTLMQTLKDRFDVVGLGRGIGGDPESWVQCDIRDAADTRRAIASFAPDVVVHCAALSKIGVCQEQPVECEAVNVTGSANVGRAAIETGARLVIGLSSDRVFQASQNQYGRSKAAMERLFIELNTSDTSFVSMRLGKVPGSPGGFLDHWKAAFRATGVIESTGPDHASFFLERATFASHVGLLIERGGEWGGRVYVPRMRAARMRDILDAWVAEFGGSWKDTSRAETLAPESSLLISAEERARSQGGTEGELSFDLIDPAGGHSSEVAQALTTADADSLSLAEIIQMLRTAGVSSLDVKGGFDA